MPPSKHPPYPTLNLPPFDLTTFLDSAGAARRVIKYARSKVVFSQGDPATHVFYIQKGSIKIAVLSKAGKEAVVGILGPGDFFGEGCLAGQPRRMATAAAISVSTVLAIEQPEMLRVLHSQPALADRFLAHMLA